MKKNICILLLSCMFTTCEDIYDVSVSDDKLYEISVQLKYPTDANFGSKEGVVVKMKSSLGTEFATTTDANGLATFNVPNGLYETLSNEQRVIEQDVYNLNGYNSGIIIDGTTSQAKSFEMTMSASRTSQLVIKELYNGGTQKDDGSGAYQIDKYVKLYNNSNKEVNIENFCLGMVGPYNAQASNGDYVQGKLVYAGKGYIPAICGIWYLPKNLVIEPYKEITIALNGAIDHTKTYSKSVDLSNADYCTYDIEDFSNTKYYPTPSIKIPTENYFKAHKRGPANAWAISVTSPAFFIFKSEVEPGVMANNPDNFHYLGGKINDINWGLKIPTKDILDAIEVFYEPDLSKCQKRFTTEIDAGYVAFNNKQGHTLYRNVDKEATEAIEGNKEKLVYKYAMGTDLSTDPSGIDAEASVRNGAIIIYQDTNNSTNDFHERKQSSLKD